MRPSRAWLLFTVLSKAEVSVALHRLFRSSASFLVKDAALRCVALHLFNVPCTAFDRIQQSVVGLLLAQRLPLSDGVLQSTLVSFILERSGTIDLFGPLELEHARLGSARCYKLAVLFVGKCSDVFLSANL